MICLCLCLCLCIRSRRLIVSSWTIGMIGSGFWQRVEQRWWLSNHRLMSRGVRCRCFHCQMMLHDCLGLPLVWHGAVECRRKKMLAVLVLVGRPSKATTKHTPNWLPVVNSACLLGAVAALGRFYCSAFKDELTRRALLTFTYTLTYTPIEAHHAQCSVTIYQSS